MGKLSIAELWRMSHRVFPILWQVVYEAGEGATGRAVARLLARELRRRGLKVRVVDGAADAVAVEEGLWVKVIGPEQDVEEEARRLREVLREEGTAQGAYLVGLGARPRWRWVQVAGRGGGGFCGSSRAERQEG